jgi:hypothetical protein
MRVREEGWSGYPNRSYESNFGGSWDYRARPAWQDRR